MALAELRPRSSACRVALPNVFLLGAAENSDYAKTQVDGTSAFQVDFFIIIYHELGLDRPVLASSNSLLNHLRPFGLASALYTFILENFWTKVGLKCCLNLLILSNILLKFLRNFTTKAFKILYL